MPRITMAGLESRSGTAKRNSSHREVAGHLNKETSFSARAFGKRIERPDNQDTITIYRLPSVTTFKLVSQHESGQKDLVSDTRRRTRLRAGQRDPPLRRLRHSYETTPPLLRRNRHEPVPELLWSA